MNMSKYAFGLCLLVAACASQVDTAPSDPSPTAAPVAARAPSTLAHAVRDAAPLGRLSQLVSTGDPEHRGFHSIQELETATLAEPLPAYFVGEQSLLAFHPGADPRALLVDEHEAVVPILVGNEVRTSSRLAWKDGQWTPIEYGRPELARTAHAMRARIATAHGVDESAVSLVEVRALSVRLLAHDEGGTLMLSPLDSVGGTDLEAGVSYPAERVFAALRGVAMRRNGLR